MDLEGVGGPDVAQEPAVRVEHGPAVSGPQVEPLVIAHPDPPLFICKDLVEGRERVCVHGGLEGHTHGLLARGLAHLSAHRRAVRGDVVRGDLVARTVEADDPQGPPVRRDLPHLVALGLPVPDRGISDRDVRGLAEDVRASLGEKHGPVLEVTDGAEQAPIRCVTQEAHPGAADPGRVGIVRKGRADDHGAVIERAQGLEAGLYVSSRRGQRGAVHESAGPVERR